MPLPPPDGKQKEVIDLPVKGHHVVLGTAGSGKTTLALYRAAHLAKRVRSGQKVLLVTFNRSLVNYLNSLSENSLCNVDIRSYHLFATGYLKYKGMLGRDDIVPTINYDGENKKLKFIKMAIAEAAKEAGHNSTLARAPEVFYEEISWIQKMGIINLEDYIDAERIGRSGTRITRDKRKYFFEVYKRYVDIRERHSYLYDWDDLARAVKEELEDDDEERMYKHIIIDEGQDLSPVMLKSLALAIPEDGSVTFFGDVAQQIYGGRISWRNAGLNVAGNEIRRLDQNYRNSREIADLAIAISKMPCFKKNADLVWPEQPAASGPKPLLAEFKDEVFESKWVINSALKLAETDTVAILVPTRELVKKIRWILEQNGARFQELDRELKRWDGRPGIFIGTYHSAKSLEFETVLIPYCSAARIPDRKKISALEDRQEALSEAAKLVYVAATRARRRLALTYSGEMTEVLPASGSIYSSREFL